MKDNFDGNGGPLGKREQRPPEQQFGAEAASPGETPRTTPHPNGHAAVPRIDFWVVLDLIAQRWHWPVLGALVCGALFYLLAWHKIHPKWTATADLQRYDTPGGPGEFFKSASLSPETFSGMIRSPELLRQ